jgi:hypothetical protein
MLANPNIHSTNRSRSIANGYCRAAVASNNKAKPHVIVVGGGEEKHEHGSYSVHNKNQWINVGNDPAEALRQRTKLVEADSLEHVSATSHQGERR